MKNRRLIVLATAVAAVFINTGVLAQGPKSLTIVPNQSFTSQNNKVQYFAGTINLTAEQAAMSPLMLKVTNGSYSGSKFAWVRGFIDAGRAAPANPRPVGRMIIDVRDLTNKNTVNLNLAGLLRQGPNAFVIQGAGVPGSSINYEVNATAAAPGGKPGAAVQISAVDPPEVSPGGTITLKGQGFDDNPSGNTVTIYNRPVKVDKASSSELTVTVPTGLAPHSYTVDVKNSSGKTSMQFDVSGPPEVSGCSLSGLQPGSTVDVYGKNFSKVAGKNVVTLNVTGFDIKKNASVNAASKESLTVTIPQFPELGERLNGGVATPAQLSVTVNGVAAPSTVQVFISIRPMSN